MILAFFQILACTKANSSRALHSPADTHFFAQGDSIIKGPTLSKKTLSVVLKLLLVMNHVGQEPRIALGCVSVPTVLSAVSKRLTAGVFHMNSAPKTHYFLVSRHFYILTSLLYFLLLDYRYTLIRWSDPLQRICPTSQNSTLTRKWKKKGP